ncbi:hypothetical protein [Streptomyces sp. NBC_00151]|uniref:hypothetical protein n=1 Tax=Streptomyces sp. NBC_00151 TaxID=2975669 RepID=UPI002DDBD688|nr:hypothetical protein [Streptomyces sp. NBC_00151]WRZ37086.1 hypothetical protein OG915_02835 [Streptomyces sp. NBC_00151]
MTDQSSLCTSTRCRRADGDAGRPRGRRAEPGSRLCGLCRRAVVRDVAALPGLHGHSESERGRPSGGAPAQRVTGSREAALPVRSSALEARHDVVAALSAWSRLVVDEVAGAAPPRRTVADMAAFLGRYAGWLAARPEAGRFADEMARATAGLRREDTAPAAGLVPLGPCVEPGCTAEVFLPRRGGEGLLLRGPVCTAGHVLTPRQWLALREAA